MSAAVVRALTGVPLTSRIGRMLIAELRLMLNGVHAAWYLGAAGFIVACAASPADVVKQVLLPAAWLWPLLLWSKMGMRESYFGTGQLIFSAPGIRARQMCAVWGAGVIVAVVTGSGAAVSLAFSGEWVALAGLAVGCVFIPSVAFASGAWSGGSRLFEAAYTIWWYLGPVNAIPALDFTGMASTIGGSGIYLLLAGGFFAAGYAGRVRQTAG